VLRPGVIDTTSVAPNSNDGAAARASFALGVAPIQIYDKRRWQCKNPVGTTGYSCANGANTDRYALLNTVGSVVARTPTPGRVACSMNTLAVRDADAPAAWPVVGPGNQVCQSQTVGGRTVNYNCCVRTRFSFEFNTNEVGTCYDPATEGCCDDGNVYTLGQQQCCALDGVKDINDGCSCGSDSDCMDPSLAVLQGTTNDRRANATCCAPPVSNPGTQFPQCNKFFSRAVSGAAGSPLNSIPSNSASQVCPGRCINPEVQLCCAGSACHAEYERCCGDQCCNERDERCVIGHKHDRFGFLSSIWAHSSPTVRPGATDPALGGPDGQVRTSATPFSVIHTADQLREQQYYCSRIEDVSLQGAFAIGYQPFFLVTATLLIGALSVTAITDRTNHHRQFSLIEKGLLFTSTLATILSILTYFGPHWKFGFTVAVIAIISALAFITRLKRAIVLGWAAHVLLILFVVNPFTGNAIASFNWENDMPVGTHGWQPSDLGNQQNQGILGHLRLDTPIMGNSRVTPFYDGYGMWDPLTRDNRFENTDNQHFGLASETWIFWQLIVVGFLILAIWVGFVLATMVVFLSVYQSEQQAQLQDEVEEELLDPLKEREGTRTASGLTFRESDGTYVVGNE
jgi:hypothetical protein